MNDIDTMPPKCHDCSYWEMCEEPYICPTQDEKRSFMSEQNTEIQYSDCADALLKLWMENIITDGEYNRIMDRLNKAHKDGVI